MVYFKMQRESLSGDNEASCCAVLYWDRCSLFNADTREPFNVDLNRHSALDMCCCLEFQCSEVLESGWSDS